MKVMQRTISWFKADRYRLALLLLALIYTVVFTSLAWDLHAGMRTHKADLGQIDQAVWNSSQGRPLVQTDNGFEATRLTDHVEPILLLISPIFWLWDDVRALLLLQVLAAAVGVLPLYALALRQMEKLLPANERRQIWRMEPLQGLARPLAFALGVAYLLNPQLQSALLTEFHAAPLSVPLILWAFWAVDARRWGQAAAAALITGLVKEEMALLAAGLGAWMVWRAWWDGREGINGSQSMRAGFAAGVAVLLLGLGWFYIATFVIVPAYAQPLYGATESTYFARYGALGDSSADILCSFVTQPGVVWSIASEGPRVAYLLGLVAAFALLPLLGVDVLLLSLPLLLANLLSAYPAQYYGEFHYSAPLVPYFAVAAAYGLGRLWRWAARRLDRSSGAFQHLPAAGSGAMAAMAMFQNSSTALRPLLSVALVVWILGWSVGNYVLHGRGPLGGRYDPTPITAHHQLLERFTAQIPREAAVTATAGVHPHVSHRRYIYQFPLGLERPDDPAADWQAAEWALLDVTTNTDMAPGDLKAEVDQMLAGEWGVVDAADGFLLLRRGAENKEIPGEFYSFVRVGVADADNDAESDAPLRLLGVTAEDWERWRQTKIVLDWQVGPGYQPQRDGPWLEVTTPAGDVTATLANASPPGLTWYGPDRWQEGDHLRITTLPLALPGVFAVRAAGGDPDDPAVYVREESGHLERLGFSPAFERDLGALLAPYLGTLQAGGPVTAQLPDGGVLSVRGWLRTQAVAVDRPLDVLLQWQLPTGAGAWPQNLSAFVHLRQDGANLSQVDGAPSLFERPSPLVGDPPLLNDWRRMAMDEGCLGGSECQVVIGVYDPSTGQRLPLLDASGAPLGDEWVLGSVRAAPARVPDQVCALTGACASQP